MNTIKTQKLLFYSLMIASALIAPFASLYADLISEQALFDYSPSIEGISNSITTNQQALDNINAQIALLQAATGYSAITTPALNNLINQQANLTYTISELQAVLTEITTLYNLDSTTQDLLYYFYTVVGGSSIDFMVRMPFNYEAALSDPIIIALLADTTNTVAAKTTIAQLVFQNYPIYFPHLRALTEIYRYQS
jgi:hypothetical protein